MVVLAIGSSRFHGAGDVVPARGPRGTTQRGSATAVQRPHPSQGGTGSWFRSLTRDDLGLPGVVLRRRPVAGEDLVQPSEGLVIQAHVECSDSTVELFLRAGTNDRGGDGGLVQ